MDIEVLQPTGVGIDPSSPMKHYWVRVQGLLLHLRHLSHVQKCIGEVGDVLELYWYTKNWLDNHWMRVKVTLSNISFLPSLKTYFLTSARKKVAHYTVSFKPEEWGIDSSFEPGEQKFPWVPKLKEII